MLVRVALAGVNFADTHARENTYLARYELPLVPGAEVAGVVEGKAGRLRPRPGPRSRRARPALVRR